MFNFPFLKTKLELNSNGRHTLRDQLAALSMATLQKVK